jgi:RNA recognition motif-containing protein
MSRRTLFVANLSETTTARDLAWECERFGPLVRCDLPTPGGRAKGFAFVEFVDERDAIAAHNDLTHRRIDGRNLTVEFARRAPAPGWRHSPGPGMAPSHGAPPPYARRPPSPPYGKRGRRDEYARLPLSFPFPLPSDYALPSMLQLLCCAC